MEYSGILRKKVYLVYFLFLFFPLRAGEILFSYSQELSCTSVTLQKLNLFNVLVLVLVFIRCG